jgi:hypothetical protein
MGYILGFVLGWEIIWGDGKIGVWKGWDGMLV